MKTSVESTTKSSPILAETGSLPLPLARAAAPLSTQTALDCSPSAVVVLTALLHSLFHHTLSSDVMWLALRQAEEKSLERGVSKKEFDRIKTVLIKSWMDQRSSNPLAGMH